MSDPNKVPADARVADPRRRAALAATGLLDATPSDVLERLTRTATRLLGVPVALVSLIDDERQWFAGLAGLTGWAAERRETPLSHSFCQHVVSTRAPLVVADATTHPLVRENLAIRDLGVRAYLGIPLTTGGGETLGAFCAIDTAPRAWTADELEALRDLATAAMADIELRITLAALRASDVTEHKLAEAARHASEERFRTLVEHASDVVGILGADGTIQYESPAIERLLGYRAPELQGQQAFDLVHPDDVPATRDRFLAVLAAPGAAAQVTYRCRHKDGSWRVLEAHAWNLVDDPGVRGVVVNARDVTARVQAEAALQESEERLRLALEVTGSVAWERDLRTGATVPRWAAFLAAVHPEDRARVVEANARAVAARADLAVDFRLVWPDGSVSWHYTKGRVLTDDEGTPTRIVGVRLDLTERVALEAQLQQAQKMEAIGQLAGGVAHDFNNLLTVISGNLEFARTDLPTDLSRNHPVRADLDEIAQAADRARTLVRQLLTFSRKQPVQPRYVRMGDLMQGAEKLLRRVIGEEIVLAVHVADRDAAVHADPGQLEQVLMNLAVNAGDAMLTPRHGHPGTGGTLEIAVDTVTLGLSATRGWDGVGPGRWVRLRVRDTGHGMDAATQAHAFEPFFTTKDVGVGTGLGLATVFGIVRQAGGAIRVESASGQGTTFTILLPAADAASVPGPGAPAEAPDSAVHATILLVEDETPVRATARRILERRGYRVREARHGADALLLWREHRAEIDAVVTDLRMPEMGGRELVAVLRVDAPGLPAVFVSGYADQASDAVRGPHETFIAKPFTADVLLSAVGKVLRAVHVA